MSVQDKATTPNGVLGSKLMWNVFDSLRSSHRPPAGTDAGLAFMRTTFGDPQFVWLRRADKVRQGIWWWRAAVTGQWALRPGQQADQPPPGAAQMVRLAQFAPRCEDGWRRWFAATGIQPGQVVCEDLAPDRLAVANRVLEFLRLPRLDAGTLPPVRYRKQADSGATGTATFLGERHARIARRRGPAKAQVAVALSLLVIIWHLLHDPQARYADLGPGHYQNRIDKTRKARNHIRQLEALGHAVTLTQAA